MKIPLMEWGTKPLSEKDVTSDYLLKVPNHPLSELALSLAELEVKPMGLVPPFDPQVRAFNFSVMSIMRDHFPEHVIYGVVPQDGQMARWDLRAMKSAGFRHFLLQWQDPWQHFHQQIHDLVGGCKIHVAGGDPAQPEWSWSEEALL